MEVLGHGRRYAMVRDAVSGVIQCGKLSVMALASFSPRRCRRRFYKVLNLVKGC
ncbi:MAG: hypothetical protein ABIM74_04005 [candidate division WOR-3 bacterium]